MATSKRGGRPRKPKRVKRPAKRGTNKGGRPTVLTAELTAKIAQDIREGQYMETAAALNGVNSETLLAWLKRGARAEKAGVTALPEDRIYLEFSRVVRQAWAEAEAAAVRAIRSSDDFRAQAWYLERTRRDRFGAKLTVAATEEEKTESPLDLSRLSTEELEQFEALAAKAQPAPAAPPAPVDPPPAEMSVESEEEAE